MRYLTSDYINNELKKIEHPNQGYQFGIEIKQIPELLPHIEDKYDLETIQIIPKLENLLIIRDRIMPLLNLFPHLSQEQKTAIIKTQSNFKLLSRLLKEYAEYRKGSSMKFNKSHMAIWLNNPTISAILKEQELSHSWLLKSKPKNTEDDMLNLQLTKVYENLKKENVNNN